MTSLEQFKLCADGLRKQIQDDANAVKNLKTSPLLRRDVDGVDKGEVIANIMLAYRHLEDARMRLGKAIQATEGGVSVYDRPRTTIEQIEEILRQRNSDFTIVVNPDGSISAKPVP